MPPRWPTPPNRQDPAYRKLDDRYTLAANFMCCSTVILGLEFWRRLQGAEWIWLGPFALTWTAIVGLNALWVLVFARYEA